MIRKLYYVNIIGSCLHNIFQGSEMGVVLQNHFHANQVADVIFIFIQFLGFFSGNPQVSAFVHFNIIYIINPVKFQDHKILKKFHVTDFQLFHLSASIQNHVFKIQETLRICGREYFYFSPHAMSGGNYSNL